MKLRSKIVSLGLSAVTAGTLAFTAAAPAAHANPVTDVCNVLPGMVANAQTSLNNAAGVAATAAGALGSAQATLSAAKSAYISAIIGYLQAAAAGTDLTIVTQTLQTATTNIGNAWTAWGTANVNNFNAQQALSVAQFQFDILSGLTALCA